MRASALLALCAVLPAGGQLAAGDSALVDSRGSLALPKQQSAEADALIRQERGNHIVSFQHEGASLAFQLEHKEPSVVQQEAILSDREAGAPRGSVTWTSSGRSAVENGVLKSSKFDTWELSRWSPRLLGAALAIAFLVMGRGWLQKSFTALMDEGGLSEVELEQADKFVRTVQARLEQEDEPVHFERVSFDKSEKEDTETDDNAKETSPLL